MDKKIKVVAIMGKSASGKDTIQNKVCSRFSLHKIVSTTTRPMRECEQEGVDYFFVDDCEFAEKLINFEMLEATDFRDWFYGTELKALNPDKINIGVFNPNGVRALLEDSRIELLVFYVISSNKERLIRSLNREENPDIDEIIRRYKTDEEDFYDIEFDFTPIINNGKKSLDELSDHFRQDIIKHFGQK